MRASPSRTPCRTCRAPCRSRPVCHSGHGSVGWSEPIESNGRLTIHQLADQLSSGGSDAPFVIDVRQASEYASGHVPGSIHIVAGDLPDRLDSLPRDRPIATICGTGYRSSIAASLLRQGGFEHVSWVANGVPAWERAGYPVDVGGTQTTQETEPASTAHSH